MRTKFIILFLLFAVLAGAGAYYWAEYRKLEEVDAHVRAWQSRMAEYITFDYASISTRLGPNTLTLEQVYITYPVLMSIDKLSISPLPENEIIEKLNISAEGVSFTVPALTQDAPWYGNVNVDYKYDPALKQMDLRLATDFPHLIQGKLQTTLLEFIPNVDIVFTYPEVLLGTINFQLNNLGLLQTAGLGQVSDAQLLAILDELVSNEQRQAVADFWTSRAPLSVNFYPEHPVPIYRLIENERLFWQHPAVVINPA
jgi:hypothetical protein